jgi:large subunit ribosomal protein L17
MLRNLVSSCISNGKINTTICRAKEVRSIVEKMVTLGKNGTLAARRRAESYVFGEGTAEKLFKNLAARFSERAGGYTRIVRYGNRLGDNAEVCSLEFVDYSTHEGKAAKAVKAELNKKKEKAAEAAE